MRKTVGKYVIALVKSLGWFILFMLMQVFYMCIAFIFKIVTDEKYLESIIKDLNSINSSNTDEIFNVYVQIVGSLTSYIEFFLVIGMIGLYIIDRQFHKDRFSFNKISITRVPQFIALGSLLNIISTIFINSFSQETLEATGYDTSIMMQGGFIGILVGVGICAPICEEITFRYFIFHNLNKANTVLAVVVSALIFGIAHGNILQSAYAFAFGAVFTVFNIRYNSILPGIIMHITINSLSVLMMLSDNTLVQISILAFAFLVSIIVVILCRLYEHRESAKNSKID